MKNILAVIVLLAISHCGIAQVGTIKTPRNVSVEVIFFSEFSPAQLATIEANAAQWLVDHSSQAVRIGAASGVYNCHNYAWHQSNGGAASWLNQTNQSNGANVTNYYLGANGTYSYQADLSLAQVLYYIQGDHSAVVTQTFVNGYQQYESKWGAWPKYRHRLTDCPYVTTGATHYSVPVFGTFSKCVGGTKNYYTHNISGATYSGWTASNSSISGSGYSVNATGVTNGSDLISVNIVSPYSGTTVTARTKAWVGPFNSAMTGVTGPVGACAGQFHNYTAIVPGGHQAGYTYSWTKPTNWNWQSGTNQQMVTISIPFTNPGGGAMRADVNNTCGWAGLSGITTYGYPCGGPMATVSIEGAGVYPNPNRQGTLYVEVSEPGAYSIAVVDQQGNEKLRSTATPDADAKLSIDVSNLGKGTFILKVRGAAGGETMNRIILE